MGKRIKLKESSLTRLIKRMVMEQTYRPMSYPQDLPDVEYSNSPMTTPAPTKTPTRTPTKTPTRPKRQDPFKVPDIKPGEEPSPKAGLERINPNGVTHQEKITMGESELIGMIERLVMETLHNNR